MGGNNKPVRNRKVLVLLPLAALPFAALLFYVFGGGQKSSDQKDQQPAGLNSSLPGAQLDDQSTRLSPDKLSLYNQMEQDSADKRSEANRDASSIFDFRGDDNAAAASEPQPGQVESPYSNQVPDGAELAHQQAQTKIAKLDSRLQQIQSAIDNAERDSATPPTAAEQNPTPQSSLDLEKLESLMESMQQEQGENAELVKMDDMMDKLLDIQHPQRVAERLKANSINNKGHVYPVHAHPQPSTRQYFGADSIQSGDTVLPVSASKPEQSFFYGDDQQHGSQLPSENEGIQAVVHQTQTLTSGATIRFRLEQAIYVAGQLIPQGASLYGQCALSGERLAVTITSIRFGVLQFPVRLIAYDYDGNVGIRIPGSINRDASKEATDQAIQSVALNSIDPSLGAQAAAAGIESAKRLLSKKVTLVKVTVKSEYPVLLKSGDN